MNLGFNIPQIIKYFSHRIERARECVSNYKDTDMYAAMTYCNIGFMQSIMTFDRENIARSLVDIDAAMQVQSCHQIVACNTVLPSIVAFR